MGLETIEDRFSRLEKTMKSYGPPDEVARPAVLIFHGCGGVGRHLHNYAKFISDLGVRVFIIDSFAARGWSRKWGARLSCNGLTLRGFERSGDVLAAVWGVSSRLDVDATRLLLAGWSHGAWAIMDLMTQDLVLEGEAKLKNPTPKPLSGVKGLFLMYPYVQFPSRSIFREWLYRPRTLMVLTLKDHLSSYQASLNLVKRLRGQGIRVDTQTHDTTHAFDERGIDRFGIMKHDPEALASTREALKDFVIEVLAP